MVIEDNDDHFELIEDALNEKRDEFDLTRSTNMESGLALLQTGKFEVCLMDLVLPDSSLHESVQVLSENSLVTPIVALTSINDINIAEKLIGAGIQDYLPKVEMTPLTLRKACRYAIQRQHYLLKIDRHNKDMQAFCASLSHDFLGSIHRISQVTNIFQSNLEQRVALTEDDLRWLSYLTQSTEEIHQLILDLRQYLSIDSELVDVESINLLSLLRSVEDSLRVTLDSDFSIEYLDADICISGHRSLLYILFLNLMTNSIKYTEGRAYLKVVCQQSKNTTIIEVSDKGIGFDNAQAVEIFEPFKRLNTGISGTGLGLSICKRVVDHHLGKISVQSSLGEGTTFEVQIPSLENEQ